MMNISRRKEGVARVSKFRNLDGISMEKKKPRLIIPGNANWMDLAERLLLREPRRPTTSHAR